MKKRLFRERYKNISEVLNTLDKLEKKETKVVKKDNKKKSDK